jgi:hypothetical protein
LNEGGTQFDERRENSYFKLQVKCLKVKDTLSFATKDIRKKVRSSRWRFFNVLVKDQTDVQKVDSLVVTGHTTYARLAFTIRMQMFGRDCGDGPRTPHTH